MPSLLDDRDAGGAAASGLALPPCHSAPHNNQQILAIEETAMDFAHREKREPIVPNGASEDTHCQQSFTSKSPSLSLCNSILSPLKLSDTHDHDVHRVRKAPATNQHPVKKQFSEIKNNCGMVSASLHQLSETKQTKLWSIRNVLSKRFQLFSLDQSRHHHQMDSNLSVQSSRSPAFPELSSPSISDKGPMSTSYIPRISTVRQHSSHVDHQAQKRSRQARSVASLPVRIWNKDSYAPKQRMSNEHRQRVNKINAVNPCQVDWRTWQEISVKLVNMPRHITIKDVRECFAKEGSLTSVELFENTDGERDGSARIRFR